MCEKCESKKEETVSFDQKVLGDDFDVLIKFDTPNKGLNKYQIKGYVCDCGKTWKEDGQSDTDKTKYYYKFKPYLTIIDKPSRGYKTWEELTIKEIIIIKEN